MSKNAKDIAPNPIHKAGIVPLAVALITTATIAPQAALADEDAGTDDTAAPQAAVVEETATETAGATTTVTATETVKDYDDTASTFDTQAEAQTYLDDAQAAYPASDGYTVTTQGPLEVGTGDVKTETTTVAEGSETFESKDAAEGYINDNTKQYEGQDGYTVESDVTERQTGTVATTTDITSDTVSGYDSEDAAKAAAEKATAEYGEGFTVTIKTAPDGGTTTKTAKGTEVTTVEETFATEDEAKAYVASLTAEGGIYAPTDSTTYTVNATYGIKAIQVIVTTTKKGDEQTTTYGPYESETDAEAALANDQEEDPSGDLHKVTYSDITATPVTETKTNTETTQKTGTSDNIKDFENAISADLKELRNDGWTIGTIDKTNNATYLGEDSGKDSYTIPAGSWIGVKQAGKSIRGQENLYYIWTPTSTSSQVTSPILILAKEKGSLGQYDSSRNTSVSLSSPSQYSWLFDIVVNDDDGTITLTPKDPSRILFVDWGTMPTEFSYTVNASKTTTEIVPVMETVTDTKSSGTYGSSKTREDALSADLKQLRADGWTIGTINKSANAGWLGEDSGKDSYTIPAGSWIGVKQAGKSIRGQENLYYIWTPTTTTDSNVSSPILILAKEKGSLGQYDSSRNTSISSLYPTQYEWLFDIADNGDGTITLTPKDPSRILFVDWGTMPTEFTYTIDVSKEVQKNTYSFTKTVQDYEQSSEAQEITTYKTVKELEDAISASRKQLKDEGYTNIVNYKYNNAGFLGEDSGKDSYTIPAGSWIGVKQAGKAYGGKENLYYIWTPTSSSSQVNDTILRLAKEYGSLGQYDSSRNTSISSLYPTQYEWLFDIADNGDGTITLTPKDPSRILFVDWGTMPTEFTFVTTATKAGDNGESVAYIYTTSDTVSYTVDTATEVPTYKADYSVVQIGSEPVYSYDASYKVTKTEKSDVTTWLAAYKVTKSEDYKVVNEADNSSHGGWAAPQTKKATSRSGEVAVPQTGDSSTSGAAAGALAALGLGIAAAGVSTRKRGKHFRA